MGIKIRKIGNIREEMQKQAERKESKGTRVNFATWVPHQDKGELRVRFLANPDNDGWLGYDQFYVPGQGAVIATEENWDYYVEEKDLWPGRRFYAPILDVKENEVKVIEIPNSIVEDILLLGDRWGEQFGGEKGDITKFDIALFKTGYGKEGVKYHADFAGGAELDISLLTLPDLEATLNAKLAYQEGKGAKTGDDQSDQIKDEVVDVKSNDAPPFVPDENVKPLAEPKRRTLKKRAE